ncbi:S24 family peptidase [Carnimonas bestiolae]|uniref:S24 family peptidase n=1 Tax=Carnimonas bestiolae TaxID=3402172 RepID=UPI003EDC5483
MSKKESPKIKAGDIDVAPGLPERLSVLINYFGTKSAAAHIAGVDANTVGRWTEKSTQPNPRLRNLLPLVQRSGMSMDWLIRGEGNPYLYSEDGAYAGVEEQPPRYKIEPFQYGEVTDIGSCSVTRDELDCNHLNAQQLTAYAIEDHSMSPALNIGDIVLVNTARTSLGGTGIFMVEFKGERLARRVQRTMRGITLLCDDPQFENIEIPDDGMTHLVVRGKIVRVTRWIR